MKNITYILFCMLLPVTNVFSQAVNISWPIDRAVFQRANTTDTATAVIRIAGQYIDCATATNPSMKYLLKTLDKNGTTVSTGSETSFSLTARKSYNISIGKIKVGWYSLEVRAYNSTTIVASASIKFGVGDVYIIAGQSRG